MLRPSAGVVKPASLPPFRGAAMMEPRVAEETWELLRVRAQEEALRLLLYLRSTVCLSQNSSLTHLTAPYPVCLPGPPHRMPSAKSTIRTRATCLSRCVPQGEVAFWLFHCSEGTHMLEAVRGSTWSPLGP